MKRANAWTDAEDAELTRRWNAGEKAAVIAQCIPGRTTDAICTRAQKLGLARRYRGWRKGSHVGQSGRFGPAIALGVAPMKVETGAQSELWVRLLTDARFADSDTATRQERRLRGGPELNHSPIGCSAAMAAAV